MMLKQTASRIDVFRGLSRAQLAELMSWIERRDCAKGSTVFSEGDDSDGLYLLCQGDVAVVKSSSKGGIRLAELNAPSFFGEAALMIDEPRSTTVRGLSKCTLGFLPRAMFQEKLHAQNLTTLIVTVNIARLLSERLMLANKRIAILSAKVQRDGKAYMNRALT